MSCEFCNGPLEAITEPGYQCLDCKLTYHFYNDEIYIDRIINTYYVSWLSTTKALVVYDIGDHSTGEEILALTGEKYKHCIGLSKEDFMEYLNKLMILL